MDVARLLADLNGPQREAVASTAAPLRILAGAGSGKTRVLTRRIARRCAEGDADPRHVLALTFTRKAAGELRDRLRHLGLRDVVAAGTFHGVAWAQLQARWADRNIRPPELLTSKVATVRRVLPPELARRPGGPRDVTGEIEWATARLVEPGGYAEAAAIAGRRSPVDPAAVDAAWREYVAAKRARRAIDFDDLLRLWRRDLELDPEFAAVQRFLFRHLFVDEFQDVNPAQHALLTALAGERSDLCVVGDPNQAIYAWNGADARYLVDFERWWPGGETVRLLDNHRSSPQVLRAANAVLAAAPGADAGTATLVPHRPDGPEPTITAADDDDDEATLVARALRDRHRPGGRWSRQAVLVRTNAQLALLERGLRAAGIPARVRGGGALLDQPEVAHALRTVEAHPGPFDAIVAELEAMAGGDDDAPDGRRANLDALARLARDFRDLGGTSSPSAFRSWLADFARADLHDPSGDAVDLLTFHAAKGLEWPIVHIAGLEDGFVPISHAATREARAEERRLLYVAITRARDEVILSWAGQRTFRDKPVRRQRSPFLDDVDQVLARRGARPPSPRAPRADAEVVAPPPTARPSRRVPDAVTAADRPLYEALDRWRAARARAARMPATVIAHDRVLVAIAASRPDDTATLAAASGLGPSTIARWGPEVLRVVAEHSDRPVMGPDSGAPGTGVDAEPEALAVALREWRRERAEALGVGRHRVLTDRALTALVTARPADVAGLRAVPGVGPKTVERHGEALLAVLAAHR